jgi:hypothetical protein
MPYREGVVEELLDKKQNMQEEYHKHKYSQTPRVLFLLGFLAAPDKNAMHIHVLDVPF